MLVHDFKRLEPFLNEWPIEDFKIFYLMPGMTRIEHFHVYVPHRLFGH